jgi:hypothetical protein
MAEDIERDGEISLSFLIPFFLNPTEPPTLTANFDLFVLVGRLTCTPTIWAMGHLVFLWIKALMQFFLFCSHDNWSRVQMGSDKPPIV